MSGPHPPRSNLFLAAACAATLSVAMAGCLDPIIPPREFTDTLLAYEGRANATVPFVLRLPLLEYEPRMVPNQPLGIAEIMENLTLTMGNVSFRVIEGDILESYLEVSGAGSFRLEARESFDGPDIGSTEGFGHVRWTAPAGSGENETGTVAGGVPIVGSATGSVELNLTISLNAASRLCWRQDSFKGTVGLGAADGTVRRTVAEAPNNGMICA